MKGIGISYQPRSSPAVYRRRNVSGLYCSESRRSVPAESGLRFTYHMKNPFLYLPNIFGPEGEHSSMVRDHIEYQHRREGCDLDLRDVGIGL
jgi:hypothetical protein